MRPTFDVHQKQESDKHIAFIKTFLDFSTTQKYFEKVFEVKMEEMKIEINRDEDRDRE